MALRPTRLIGYIHLSVTTVQPSKKNYWFEYTYTFSSSYLPSWKNWTDYCSLSGYETNKHIFKVNQTDLYKGPIVNNTICNVQPSQKLAPGVIAPLANFRETWYFLKNYPFQDSDHSDSEYFQLCKVLVENNSCYATHRNVVKKTFTLFWIRLKPVADLQTQRPSEVPTQNCDKLNTFWMFWKKMQ